MPGILGIITNRPSGLNEQELTRMIDTMDYEPFYRHGSYVDRNLGIYAGWVTLQGSFSDCMPISNETKDVVLIFDGENFADDQVLERLRAAGHTVEHKDARILVHLYEEEGDNFFKSLNGWFSGLLLDLRTKKAVLFNDRFGMRKIYYHESDKAFYFASEAKALLAVRPELRELDLRAVGEQLGANCTLGTRSLFKGISHLPGGAAWTWYGAGNLQKKLYFEPHTWEQQSLLDGDRFYQQFKQTFTQVLPRYFNSGQVAMSLTAGLDTRLIMACLNPKPDRLPCFTFGGVKDETLDMVRAREVAQACGQSHQIIRLQQDFFSEFGEFAQKTVYISDGCLDVCSSHDLYFNRIVRQIAPIRMTGKFGSEVVRNRSMFKPVRVNKRIFHPDLRNCIDQAVITLKELQNCHPLTMSVFKELPWNEYGRLAVEQSQLTLRTPYMDNDLLKLLYQAPNDVRTSHQTQLRLIEEYNPALRSILTNRGTAGSSGYLVSMLSQLFYYGLLKADYIYLYAMPHWLTALTSRLAPLGFEKLFLGRQKFEHYRLWLRDQLADFVCQILLDRRTLQRPFFDPSYIRRMVAIHTRGDGNYFMEINKALTLELICRQLLENWT